MFFFFNLGFSQDAFQKKFFHCISSVYWRQRAVRLTGLKVTAMPCGQPLLIIKSPPCFKLKIVSSKGRRSTALAGNSLAHKYKKAHKFLLLQSFHKPKVPDWRGNAGGDIKRW